MVHLRHHIAHALGGSGLVFRAWTRGPCWLVLWVLLVGEEQGWTSGYDLLMLHRPKSTFSSSTGAISPTVIVIFKTTLTDNNSCKVVLDLVPWCDCTTVKTHFGSTIQHVWSLSQPFAFKHGHA